MRSSTVSVSLLEIAILGAPDVLAMVDSVALLPRRILFQNSRATGLKPHVSQFFFFFFRNFSHVPLVHLHSFTPNPFPTKNWLMCIRVRLCSASPLKFPFRMLIRPLPLK